MLFLGHMLSVLLAAKKEFKIPLSSSSAFVSYHELEFFVSKLLTTRSGGRYPVFVVFVVIRCLGALSGRTWDCQSSKDRNESDFSAGAGGDITR